MQRPESMKTRGSTAAAAELEWQRGEEEDDWKEKNERPKVTPIYRERITETARETRR